MATLWPLQLPYGLSSYHRHVNVSGKGVSLPYDDHQRWQTLTLQQLSSTHATACNTSSTPQSDKGRLASPSKLRPRKRRWKSSSLDEMGVAGSKFHDSSIFGNSRTVTASAKDRRRKTRRSQNHASSVKHDKVKAGKKRKKSKPKPLVPGTRLGAHQQLPITINSDESDTDGTLDAGGLVAARCVKGDFSRVPHTVTTSPSNTPASRQTPCSNGSLTNTATVTPTLDRIGREVCSSPVNLLRQIEPRASFAQPSLVPLHSEHGLFEERLVSAEPSLSLRIRRSSRPQEPCQPDHASSVHPRLRRARTASTGSSNTRIGSTTAQNLGRHWQNPSWSLSYADQRVELTLADIPDFSLRKKVAQLMAVAPGLPTSDLYHLLVESKGEFENAKQQVLRRNPGLCSPARSVRSIVSPEIVKASFKHTLSEQIHRDCEDDEVMVKLDLDDPDFMWDNNAPATPAPIDRRKKVPSKPRTKQLAQKYTTNPTMIPVRAARTVKSSTVKTAQSASASPALPKMYELRSSNNTNVARTLKNSAIPSLHLAGTRVKERQTLKCGEIDREMRETSYDRSFIVPDEDVLVEDSSDSYVDSSASDVDTDDDCADLSIDMKPTHAHTAEVLSSLGYR